MKRLLINCEKLQTRAALTENGKLEDYEVERVGGTTNIVGAIYKGRVRNLEDSLQAAFVDIGLRKNAFLHYWDMVPADEDDWDADGDDDSDDGGGGGSSNSDGSDDDDGGSDDGGGQKRRRRRRRRGRGGQNNDDQDNNDQKGSDGNRGGQNQKSDRNKGKQQDGRKQSEGSKSSQKGGNKKDEPTAELAITKRLVRFFKSCVTPATEDDDQGGDAKSQKSRKGGNSGGKGRSGNDNQQKNNDGNRGGRQRRGRGGDDGGSSSGNRRGNNNRNDNNKGGNDGGSNQQKNDGGGRNSGNNKGGGNNRGGKGGRRRQRPKVDVSKVPQQFPVDSEVIVQITKGMIGEKGPRVTTNLSLPGRFLVLLPNSDHRGVSKRIESRKERTRLRNAVKQLQLPKGMGVICRTAATNMEVEDLQSDVEILVEKWRRGVDLLKRNAPVCIYKEPDLAERMVRDLLSDGIQEIVVDNEKTCEYLKEYLTRLKGAENIKVIFHQSATPMFEHYKISDQIRDIFQRKVRLPSGAELCLDETEALIAIDINSGRSRGGKDHPETILNTNLEAADEIARQLRLRNVGGLVVVDFIDMRPSAHRKEVYRRFKDALNRDRARTKVLPISNLGLLEMTRQREHESLQDSFFEECHYCSGTGLVKSAMTVSVEIQRALRAILRQNNEVIPIRVMVHPVVLQRLKDKDSSILREMEETCGGELSFRADETVHRDEFKVVDTRTNRVLHG